MTFPRVLSDWLMADPSLRRSPVAPVDSALSLWNLMGSTNKRQCDMLVTHNNIIILKYHEQVHVHVIKRNLIQVHSPTTTAQFQNKHIWFYTSNTFITLKLIFLKCMFTQISHNSSIFLQLTSTAQTTFKHIVLKILAKASRLYSNTKIIICIQDLVWNFLPLNLFCDLWQPVTLDLWIYPWPLTHLPARSTRFTTDVLVMLCPVSLGVFWTNVMATMVWARL